MTSSAVVGVAGAGTLGLTLAVPAIDGTEPAEQRERRTAGSTARYGQVSVRTTANTGRGVDGAVAPVARVPRPDRAGTTVPQPAQALATSPVDAEPVADPSTPGATATPTASPTPDIPVPSPTLPVATQTPLAGLAETGTGTGDDLPWG